VLNDRLGLGCTTVTNLGEFIKFVPSNNRNANYKKHITMKIQQNSYDNFYISLAYKTISQKY